MPTSPRSARTRRSCRPRRSRPWSTDAGAFPTSWRQLLPRLRGRAHRPRRSAPRVRRPARTSRRHRRAGHPRRHPPARSPVAVRCRRRSRRRLRRRRVGDPDHPLAGALGRRHSTVRRLARRVEALCARRGFRFPAYGHWPRPGRTAGRAPCSLRQSSSWATPDGSTAEIVTHPGEADDPDLDALPLGLSMERRARRLVLGGRPRRRRQGRLPTRKLRRPRAPSTNDVREPYRGEPCERAAPRLDPGAVVSVRRRRRPVPPRRADPRHRLWSWPVLALAALRRRPARSSASTSIRDKAGGRPGGPPPGPACGTCGSKSSTPVSTPTGHVGRRVPGRRAVPRWAAGRLATSLRAAATALEPGRRAARQGDRSPPSVEVRTGPLPGAGRHPAAAHHRGP